MGSQRPSVLITPAHEELHRPNAGNGHRLALPRRVLMQAELDAQLVLGGSAPQVDLVAKDQEGHVIQVLAREQALLTHERAVAAAR